MATLAECQRAYDNMSPDYGDDIIDDEEDEELTDGYYGGDDIDE